MHPYKNKSGKESGVTAYSIGRTYIDVRFSNGAEYRYSNKSAGKENIEWMKKLANNRQGLSTFISQHKPPYERILKQKDD
ncbi:MAG: hypothetical protein U0V74_09060 [Chitinophagales bacterium]